MTTKRAIHAPANDGELQGIVQLGGLSAPGTWTDGEILSIRFSTATLNGEQRLLISRLKSYPNPIPLTLGGKRATGDNHIVGFEENSGTVTFHVSRSEA